MKAPITVNPIPGFDPRIGLYLAQLEDVRERTKRYVDGLTQAQLEWHPNPKVESIGTMLIHVAAVELSWIQEDIRREPMGEEWRIGFPIRFGIPQISGESLAYFIGLLDSTRAVTRDVLAGVTDADLSRALVPLDDEDTPDAPQFTIEWILYHLIEHEAHHKGQIAVMKRLLPDTSL